MVKSNKFIANIIKSNHSYQGYCKGEVNDEFMSCMYIISSTIFDIYLLPRQNPLTFSMASGIVMFLEVNGHFTSIISGFKAMDSNSSVKAAIWWL